MAEETYPSILTKELGEMVQILIDAGTNRIAITRNADGATCTVVVTLDTE